MTTPADAARILLHRRQCRASLLAYATHVVGTDPRGPFAPALHHQLLIASLQWVADTPDARLMVMMPPGSAKSTYASVIFPSWMMSRPGTAVIGGSHTAGLALDFSGKVQGAIVEHGAILAMRLKNEAKDRWYATNGSAYLASGVGGAVTGFRADVVIIDDPVKSRADADSETYRNTTWAWYNDDLTSRMRPGGRVVLVMTRWHEDDLAGRLLASEPDKWRVLRLPAFAYAADDPLGRAIGAPLWGDDGYGFAKLLADRREDYLAKGLKRSWAALYQQSPRADDGNLFKIEALQIVDALGPIKRSVRRWDLAATDDGGDWTAGVLVHHMTDDRFVIGDVVRLRGGPERVEAAIVATASRDGRSVRIALPQDPGQAGKSQVLYLTRKLAGYVVESAPETGDKATRAAPVAAQANIGNLALLRADWNLALIEEMRSFPSGLHDDQVDALAGGFNVLTAAPRPASVRQFNHMTR